MAKTGRRKTKKVTTKRKGVKMTTEVLEEARQKIKELEEELKKIAEAPLEMVICDSLSEDKKFAFIKHGANTIRVMAVKGLEKGDQILIHPMTKQIVERIGKPPLEKSIYAPSTVPNVTWDDIGGLEDAKQDMIEAIELPHRHKNLFVHYNKRQLKGILLFGPPGCGKTLLGKAAANSLATIYGKNGVNTGFLYVKGPEILDQYVGQTELAIRNIFADAKRHKDAHGYPALVFIDEADAILGVRGGRGTILTSTIVPSFLTEMDGLEESAAIVVIATNRPDGLDPAIVRDGRIDRKIEVTRPNMENGAKIIALNLKKVPMAEETIEKVAAKTAYDFYGDHQVVKKGVLLRDIVNGAMLANCVDIATSQAIHRDIKHGKKSGVSFEDMAAAVDRIRKQSSGVRHDLEEAA